MQFRPQTASIGSSTITSRSRGQKTNMSIGPVYGRNHVPGPLHSSWSYIIHIRISRNLHSPFHLHIKLERSMLRYISGTLEYELNIFHYIGKLLCCNCRWMRWWIGQKQVNYWISFSSTAAKFTGEAIARRSYHCHQGKNNRSPHLHAQKK